MKVKICGVTTGADALAVVAAGADYLGLNLWSGSKRYVTVEHATKLAAVVRNAAAESVGLVGVFVDADPALIIAATTAIGLDVIQLHGDESPVTCEVIATATGRPVWKAIAARGTEDVVDLARWPVDAIVLDAPSTGRGGSGTTFDWDLARRAVDDHPSVRIVLAGGLVPEIVADAVARVRPWAVDVASGVETVPGTKDHDKIRAFVAAARGAAQSTNRITM